MTKLYGFLFKPNMYVQLVPTIITINSIGNGIFLSCFLNFSFTKIFKVTKNVIATADTITDVQLINALFLNKSTYVYKLNKIFNSK